MDSKNIKDYTLKDLKEIAKKEGIEGFNKLNKADLFKVLLDHFYPPDKKTGDFLNDKDKYMYLRGDDLFDAVIYGDKDISETYPKQLNKYKNLIYRKEDIVEIDKKLFVIKNGFGPFIWIAKIEKLKNLSLITFTWNNTQGKKLFNNYFNGKMFGYSDSAIKKYYLKIYGGIAQFNEDKNNFNNLCEELLNMEEYKNFVEVYYPELK